MPTPHTTRPIAVVLCRVSSGVQAGPNKTSLDDQERRGLETAARLGATVLYVARHAESAWVLDKRSQFQQVLADARESKFNLLIVDRMNRFSRSEDLSDPIVVLRELKDLGVQVEFCDRQYSDDMFGQFLQLTELLISGREQQQRQQASRNGKIGRATKHGHPVYIRQPYGYVWAPAAPGQPPKTHLIKDPGQAQAVIERIWHYFLDYVPTPERPRPTLHAVRVQLNKEQIPPPTIYHGIKDNKGTRLKVWNTRSIAGMLRNGVYWGEPTPALAHSKYTDHAPIPIPAYAPPYVTPEEAARVHAILAQNAAHSGRPRGRDYGTLLHGGLCFCGYCGRRLDPSGQGRKLPDGSKITRYHCWMQVNHGAAVCKGVNIRASTLDWAVQLTLDEYLRSGHFLDRLFAAWEADETAALGSVRIAQAALDDARAQVANLAIHAALIAPESPAGAALQQQLEQVGALVPGLERRVAEAQATVNTVRGNVALCQDLKEWFAAWLEGFHELSRERKREFLFAIQAKVTVWRTADRQPRAELVIGLPTNTLMVPPAPEITMAEDGWHVPLALDEGARIAAAEAAGLELPLPTREELPHKQAWDPASAEEVVATARAEVAERSNPPTA